MENTPARQVRSARTSSEQLETYISFLEENPQFLAGKNTPENSKYLEEKWGDLSKKLNSLKGPQKNAKEWKQSLTHWKNQLKSRARKIKEDQTITGGGEPSTIAMSAFEQRALQIFGMITIQGDDVPVMGFPTTTNNDDISTEIDPVTPEAILEENIPEISQPSTSRKRQYNSSFSNAVSDCVSKIANLASERVEYEKKMAEERLAIDKQNADALTRMAEALYVIAQLQKK